MPDQWSASARSGKLPRLPLIERASLPILNAWYRRRLPLQLKIGGLDAAFAPRFIGHELDATPKRRVQIRIGNTVGIVSFPDVLLQAVLGRFLAPGTADLRDSVALLLLEYALLEDIEALEAFAGVPITFTSFVEESEKGPNRAIAMQGVLLTVGQSFPVQLELPSEHADWLVRRLERAPLQKAKNLALTVTSLNAIGFTNLSLSVLSSLRPNDVLLADVSAGKEMFFLRFGGGWSARAKIDGGRAVLLERLARRSINDWEVYKMPDRTVAEMPNSDAQLDDIIVKVSFELGRTEFEIGELAKLVPGYVFDLSRDARTAVDIVVGSRRIGSGEVVQIGNTLGVRITRLFNNE